MKATGADIMAAMEDHLGDLIEWDPDVGEEITDYLEADKQITIAELNKKSFRVHVLGNLFFYELWRRQHGR